MDTEVMEQFDGFEGDLADDTAQLEEKKRLREQKKQQFANFKEKKQETKRNKKMRKNTIKVCNDDFHHLYTCFQSLHKQYQDREIKDYEFIAAYILLYWKNRYPSSWLLGRFVENLQSGQTIDPFADTLSIEDLPNFELNEYERNRIYSVMGLNVRVPSHRYSANSNSNNNNNTDNDEENNDNNEKIIIIENPEEYPRISVISIYHYFLLTGLPPYVNICLNQWALGNRKIRLLFEIPSSDDVFYWQSIGERCITAFIEEHELSRLLKDHYPPFEERDALSFLLHDIQHMEKFADPMFYYEQIGFCHVLRKYMKSGVWDAYEKYDKEFVDDIEHVISDMNACSVHLFCFFKSKVFLAEQRYIKKNKLHLPPLSFNYPEKLINDSNGYLSDYQKKVVLSPIFEAWGLPPDVRAAADVVSMSGTLRDIDRTHTDLIRAHFDRIGRDVYSSIYSA